MLAHASRVASCQTSADLIVQHWAAPCALNSVVTVQLVKNPACRGGFSGSWRLRCRSSSGTTQVERLAAGREGRGGRGRGGKKRHNELRSCRVAAIWAAEVEGSSDVDGSTQSSAFEGETGHHESAAALFSTGAESAAVQDGEWQSFGRDGGVERLSTSSSSSVGSGSVVAFNNNVGTTISFGTTEFGTVQSAEWPVDHEDSTAAEEGLGLRNGDGLHNVNGIVPHPEINSATEAPEDEQERDALRSDEAGLPGEQLFVEQEKIKKGSTLGVRKPSLELPSKIDPVLRSGRFNIAERQDELPEPQPEPELEEDLEYYNPKVGDRVTGVVVSGNEYQLDIEIGAKQLGRMLSKDLKPFDTFRPDEFFWELDESGSSMPATSLGQVRFLGDREALRPTYPLVPVGTVLTLEVHGVTLSGKAVLSARKIASRIAWQRVRQICKQDEPIEAQCVAWNADGLVFKIEGVRAVLPVNEFLNRSYVSKSLKDYVGEWRNVLITDVDEVAGMLLVSEKRAWISRNIQIGLLVAGTVRRVLPFGVEINLDGTSLRGILHISNISQCYIPDINSVFSAGEKVKALVINSGNPRRIGLSTAGLESSQGLMLEDKQKVFEEAEEMAARHQSTLSAGEKNEIIKNIDTHRKFEEPRPANEDWLDFGDDETSMLDTSENEQ